MNHHAFSRAPFLLEPDPIQVTGGGSFESVLGNAVLPSQDDPRRQALALLPPAGRG
jgi:hypothetical protein